MEGFVYRAIITKYWLKLNTFGFTNNESLPKHNNNYLKSKENESRKSPHNSIINKKNSDNLHKSYKKQPRIAR